MRSAISASTAPRSSRVKRPSRNTTSPPIITSRTAPVLARCTSTSTGGRSGLW